MPNKIKYEKLAEKVTIAELKPIFIGGGNLLPKDPTYDFPSWIWPYIQRAVKAGKLTFNRRSRKLAVPAMADINDYPLPVIGVIQKAGIAFPNVKLAELPENYFELVKTALDSKKMNQYGDVDPEDFHDIPRPLWPYVRVKGRLGAILVKVGKVDPENPKDFPPGLWPYIEPAEIKLVRK